MFLQVFGRSLLLSHFVYAVPRRTAAVATNSRQLSESTEIRSQARQFVKMLKEDGFLNGLILSFLGICGFVSYNIFTTRKNQPRDVVGLPKVGQRGYKHSDFKRDI